MSKRLELVNGLPIMVDDPISLPAYDESIYFASGLAANTPITLPNSGDFQESDAADLLVFRNSTAAEEGRDFTVVGAVAPFTQIQFSFDLPSDTVVRFKQNV